MSKIFTRNFRVRWSEMDAGGQVSPDNYLRYLVETAYDWGDALGLGAKNDGVMGLFWLIRETEIHLLRPLRHNDLFDFTIWMVNWQRVRGTRCFEITLRENGQVAALGTQHIVCMDRKTLRPTNPPEDVIEHFRLEEPRVFPYDRFPKISSAETVFTTARQVEWHDLDAQEHVNNAVYLTYAEETILQEFSTLGWSPARLAQGNLGLAIRRVHIQYLSPAVWGEKLVLSSHELQMHASGGRHYVHILRADQSNVAECILDWQLVDKHTGAEQLLPDELASGLKRQAG